MTEEGADRLRGAERRDDVVLLGSGAGAMIVGRLLGRGAQFLVQVVVARVLGPVAFGIYALGWTALKVLETWTTLGLQNGVVRFGGPAWIERPEQARRVVRVGLASGAVISTTLACVLFGAADLLAVELFEMASLGPVLRIFALALPLVVLTRIAATVSRISHRMGLSVLAEDVAQPLLNLLLLAALVPVGLSLGGATIATTVSFAGAFGLALVVLRVVLASHPPDPRIETLGGPSISTLLRYSISTGLANALGYYVIWIDRIFLGVFRTPEEVGVYQVASQLSLPILVVIAGFTSVVGPMVARIGRGADPTRLNQVFRVSTKWGLYLCLPLFLVTIFGARPLIDTIFGTEFLAAKVPLVILAAGQMINVATGPVGMILIMCGHHRLWLVTTASSVGGNLILNWLLVPSLGPVGAALATSIVLAGMLLAALIQARRRLGLWPYDRCYLKGLAATAVTSLVLLGLGALDLGPVPLVQLGAIIVVVALCYPAMLLLLGLDAEDRIILDRFRLGRSAG